MLRRPPSSNGQLLVFALLTQTLSLGWCAIKESDYFIDTIIIGAGAAGIRAAQVLTKEKRNTVVLEARGRPGGRIYTTFVGGIPVEAGATALFGNDLPTFMEVVPLAKIKTTSINANDRTLFTADGTKLSDAQKGGVDAAHKDLMISINSNYKKKAEWYAPLLPAVQNYIEETAGDSAAGAAALPATFPEGQAAQINFSVNVNIEQKYGTGAKDLSLVSFDSDQASAGSDIVFTNGMSQVITAQTSGRFGMVPLDIRYDHIVYKVQYEQDKVRIDAVSADGSTSYDMYCKQVIVTVPLGVLKAKKIDFQPPLGSAKESAINRLGFGSLERVILRFPYVFWDNTTMLQRIPMVGIARSAGRFTQFINMHKLTGAAVLVATLQGLTAQEFAAPEVPLAQRMEEVMGVLRAMYGLSIPEPIGVEFTAWSNDPWTYGARTFIAAGSTPLDLGVLYSPLKKKLYFAGEHTSQQHFGTVHGAWESGEKVAKLILNGGSFAVRALPDHSVLTMLGVLALVCCWLA